MLLSWPGWQRVNGVVDYHMFNERLLDILKGKGYGVMGNEAK